jgi:hypothetical protein
MSKGDGYIQRAIRDEFTQHPERTYTVQDLAAVVFPGMVCQTKHRVAICRAADKIVKECGWIGQRGCAQGGPIRYRNSRATRPC